MAELEKLLCTDSKVESLKKINAIIDKTDETGTGLQMFDTILKDHILTYEESKGLALQGTYVYKDAIAGSRYGYPDFYAKCLEEYNQATDTETVNGKTVKVHSNGHKFYNIADKTGIDEFFSTMGSAWFYGVDTENERIFLPRRNILNLTPETKINVYGDGNALMLTGNNASGNVTGRWLSHYAGGGLAHTHYLGNKENLAIGEATELKNNVPVVNAGAYRGVGVATAEASDGKSAGLIADLENISTNQEYLYICVGNTVSDTSWVDVVTQVEGGVKDLEDKTNEGIEALSNASNALRQTQITNCLLEVPQNIKLELTDGVLTLKAGSKVIVPNGVEEDGVTPKFDEIGINSDINFTSSETINGEKFIYLRDNNKLWQYGVIDSYSGVTAPTLSSKYAMWYDTSNNIVKHTSDTGTSWNAGYSLPFAIVSMVNGEVTSIDQIFNGMGYIGSTLFVDKEVKGLIPDGRNGDGTLNNREFTTSKILTRTFLNTENTSNTTLLVSGTAIRRQNAWYYNEEQNLNIHTDGNAYLSAYYGNCDITNGVISNFRHKLPFRAIDYSDKPKISGWGMPSSKYIDLTLGASATSYTAPANGYYYINKNSSAASQYLNIVSVTSNMVSQTISSTSGATYALFLPVTKGEQIQVGYNFGGATNAFKFIYAQGEV